MIPAGASVLAAEAHGLRGSAIEEFKQKPTHASQDEPRENLHEHPEREQPAGNHKSCSGEPVSPARSSARNRGRWVTADMNPLIVPCVNGSVPAMFLFHVSSLRRRGRNCRKRDVPGRQSSSSGETSPRRHWQVDHRTPRGRHAHAGPHWPLQARLLRPRIQTVSGSQGRSHAARTRRRRSRSHHPQEIASARARHESMG